MTGALGAHPRWTVAALLFICAVLPGAASAQATGVTVSPTNLTLAEGATASYTVVLDAAPTETVTITVTASDATSRCSDSSGASCTGKPGVTTVDKSSLTFTTTDWDTAQTVTVTATDEDMAGLFKFAEITHAASGGNYDGLSVSRVRVTVTDNDRRGIGYWTGSPGSLQETSALVGEEGSTRSLYVSLESEPAAATTVTLASADTGRVTVSPASLTFTTTDWNVAQSVSLELIDNDVVEDRVQVKIESTFTGEGSDYVGYPAPPLTVNVDNDDVPPQPGVTVSPTNLTIAEAETASYTVVLDAAPTETVTITVTSSDDTSSCDDSSGASCTGKPGVSTVDKSSLTFTTTDWDAARTVTVTATDEDMAGLFKFARIAHAATGGNYDGLSVSGVRVTVTDNDTRDIRYWTGSPGSLQERSALGVYEGSTGSYYVSLKSEPTAATTVTFASQDTGRVVLSTASLTFTTTNWNVAQSVSFAVADNDVDGSQVQVKITSALSGDGSDYAGYTARAFSINVEDNDTRDIRYWTGSPGSLQEGSAATGYEGSTGTYYVSLKSEPTAATTVTLASQDASRVTVSPASLTFTPANWKVAQPVSFTLVDNDVVEGRVQVKVTSTFSGDGSDYDGYPARPFTVNVDNNDTRDIRYWTGNPENLQEDSALGTYEGSTGSYYVSLKSEPTAATTVTFASQDASRVTVSPTSLTFSPANWDVAQPVSVAVADNDVLGESRVQVKVTSTFSGSDYDGYPARAFTVNVYNNDTPPVTMTFGDALAMGFGWSGEYPGPVTIRSESVGRAAAIAPASVQVTEANYTSIQFTLTGVEVGQSKINLRVGSSLIRFFLVKVTSRDEPLKVMDVRIVSVTHDRIALRWSSVERAAGYRLVLRPRNNPNAISTVIVRSIFTSYIWKGLAPTTTYDLSAIPEAAQGDTVHLAGWRWWEGEATTLAAPSPRPGLVLSPKNLTVDEGSTATYTAALATEPGGDVTVSIAGAALGVTVQPSSLAFGAGDWSTARPVVVTAEEDSNSDSETVVLRHAAAGGGYDDVSGEVTVRTIDNDGGGEGDGGVPTVSLFASPNPVDEGAPVTVTARLSRALTGAMAIPLTLTAGTAEAGDYGSLAGITIGAGSTSGAGTVTTAADSDWDDETFTVALGSMPPEVAAGSRSSVVVTIRDRTGGGGGSGGGGGGGAPAVSLSASPNPVDEGGTVTVTARLSRALSADVAIPLTLAAGTAEAGDYGTLGSITIGAGATSGTGTVTTADDADEDDETFTVALGSLPPGLAAGTPSSVVVTIRDHTPPPRPDRPPTVSASCEPCSIPRGGEVRLTATASDPDGDPLAYSWSAGEGSFAGPANEATARWTAPGELGRFRIQVRVHDGQGGSASAHAEIEVINRGPAFEQPIYRFDLPENQDGRQRPVALGRAAAEDPDGDALTYEIASGDLERFTVGAPDGVVRYVGSSEDFEAEPNRFELAVRVRDGSGVEARAQVVVTVVDVNELPEVSASCDPCSAPRGGELRLVAEASDPDGDPLAYAWSAMNGSFLERADSAVARWRAAPELGTVKIRVRVADGRGGAASAEVEVEVTNRAPAFGQPVYRFALPENRDGRERAVDLGRVAARDSDDDPLTYEAVSGDLERFAIEVGDGAVTYVGAGEDFEAAPNRFELIVRARDGIGGEARAEVVVEVTDVNERPVALDDAVETAEDETVSVDVLANDTDPDGDGLRVESVSGASHGTARVGPDGGVTYTPDADWHGIDTFTYIVSDGGGLTAKAGVEVTVLPVNDAPTAVGSIPDQALDEGGGEAEVDLSPFFGDIDGDTLTYAARASDPGIVKVAIAGPILTLTPIVYGSATVTVMAADPAGSSATQTLQVGVSDRRQGAILENMLAATARGHLASVRGAVGSRIGADPCEPSRLSVMGRSVPLGREAATTMLEATRDRARSAAAALGLGAGAEELPAGMGMFTVPDTGAPRGEAAREAADRWAAGIRSAPARVLGLGGAVGRTDFLLSWGGRAPDENACSGRGRWSLWGQGDAQSFEGTPALDGYESGYNGELSTGYVGIDAGLGEHWLAGVALSRSRSAGDWRVGASNGRLTQTIAGIHPYLRWTGETISAWASVGAGSGRAENLRESGRLGTSGINLRLGVIELKRRFGAQGGFDFSLLGDAAWAALWTEDGAETIDGQDARVNQIRLGADLSLHTRVGGAALTPFGTVYARRDGGTGQAGSGVEVAGGLRAALGIVRLVASARVLAQHSAAGYAEQGRALTLAIGRPGGEGLSLSVSPRWGDATVATGTLGSGPLGLRPARQGRDPSQDGWTLDGRGNYGIKLPDGRRLDIYGSYGPATGGASFGVRLASSRETRKAAGGR